MTLLLLILMAFLIYYLFIYKANHVDLLEVNKINKCPSCGNRVEKNFNVCPICKETLKKFCTNCGEKIDIHWNYCPYCEKYIDKGVGK
ncbi:zinc ribbon domain-containing protein [Thermotalea metallivorans]|uniref:DZANK-type domain-containing protein n=1 Tax=Thermotalea metallivorans TaxID=520762 RepID=A0A140L065_9FIRM|nr:zinc ribbon domain-containing protein [Thermotalea metallivorans]KXG73940.1 hypothetical protein AN619_27490 [Thermotalea metallivorans]